MESLEWAPQEESLNFILEVLRDSLVPDSEIQRKVQEKIIMMQKHPDFVNYLLYVLKCNQVYGEHMRALSAIILKNNISTTFDAIPNHVVDRIRQECLQLMMDPSKDVRASVTTLIGTLVSKGSISSWPNLIPYLCSLLDSADMQLSETALTALFKICEEYLSKRGTEKEETNESVNLLVSKFISLVTNERNVIRRDSIKLLNQAMRDSSPSMKLHFDSNLFINNLLQIMEDTEIEIQKLICQAFVIFIEKQDTAILPHMHNVIEYILLMTEQEDEEIALQAGEFWLATSKLSTCRDIVIPYIERLLPILLRNMRYSTSELEALKNYVGIDEHLEDKPDDIQPFHIRASVGTPDELDFELCNMEGHSYELTDAIGEPYIRWTLRKCSAASLDALAAKFGDDILPFFIPLINVALMSEDFLIKESGILALGAIADGCMNGMRPYLPNLMQYLLTCMTSDQSLIRVITCWTISRYMLWMMEEQHSVDTYFIPVMTVLLKHFLDGNKRVQRSALSAFCIFQEEARMKLVPYIGFILQTFFLCFEKYKFRSYLLLYDAIGVLAQSVGIHLNNSEYIELLMPPLMHKFNQTEDYYDEQFMTLMDCLSNVAIALEVGFLPYTEIIYNRCILIITETITSIQCYIENPDNFELPDKDLMGVAYDMLLGMAIGLKMYFVKFVTNSNLVQSMYYSLQDEMAQVRQPALALYGELVKLCFSLISSTVHDYIPIIIENLNIHYDIACNNAAWVIGKLCIALGNKIAPHAPQILERFLEILQTVNGAKTMYPTVAISFCILGLVCPEPVAPHLTIFMRACCQAMRNVGDCEEKDVGFRGLCELIMRNPNAVVNDFIYFCDAVASFNEVRSDLKETVKNIIVCFQTHLGEVNWIQFYEQFPPILKLRLNKLYGI